MEIGKSQFDGLVEVIGRYSKPIAASVQYFAKKVTSKFSVEIAAVFHILRNNKRPHRTSR